MFKRKLSTAAAAQPTLYGALIKNNNFVMFFENVLISKRDIYKQLKGKAGVYIFINNITRKLYVGSSIVLSKIMASHFYHGSIKLVHRKTDTKSFLYRAMRKYKLENFFISYFRILCIRYNCLFRFRKKMNRFL